MKSTVIKYTVTVSVCLLIAVGVSFLRSLYWQTDAKSVMMALADTFSIPGLLVLFSGLLVACSNHGAFYMFSFAGKKFISLFKKIRSEEDKMTYYEYREMKSGKRRDYSYMLICGGAFLLAGIVFFFIYMSL